MAFVGLKYSVAAPITGETFGQLPTYGPGFRVGGTMNANVAFQRRDQRLDVDDVLSEYDNTVTGGTIALGIDDLEDTVAEKMCGDVKNEDGEYMETDALPAYVGYGNVRKRRHHGVVSFYGYWYPKTVWAKGDEDQQTNRPDSGFQTPVLNGTLAGVYLLDADGKGKSATVFRARKKFDSEAAAIAWVNAKAGITGT